MRSRNSRNAASTATCAPEITSAWNVPVERYVGKKLIGETLAAIAAGVAAAALLMVSAKQLFDDPMKAVELPTFASWMHVPPSVFGGRHRSRVRVCAPVICRAR